MVLTDVVSDHLKKFFIVIYPQVKKRDNLTKERCS
jgi:hypothetical protein